jgi:hypothetical protein
MKQPELGPMTEDDRVSGKIGAWMGLVVTVLVMIPSLYRLANEPFHWGDAGMLVAGRGLIVFHMVRLTRLKRLP